MHAELHLESATVALTGASLLMLISISTREEKIAEALSKIEWLQIYLFRIIYLGWWFSRNRCY